MDGIDAVHPDERWWRQVPEGIDPLGRPPIPADGRWQRGHANDALYVADSHDTAWAEWYRWLSEGGLPPAVALPRELWQLKVRGDQFADLGSERALAAVGLRLPKPDRSDWPEFQAVGESLAGEGYAGLIAPSAARRSGRVLCIFWPPRPGTSVESVGNPERLSAPPAPPRGLRT